jgi:hypothetical protein
VLVAVYRRGSFNSLRVLLSEGMLNGYAPRMCTLRTSNHVQDDDFAFTSFPRVSEDSLLECGGEIAA